MGFLHGDELTDAIRKTVSAGPVEMAVAFWGDNALDLLALPTDLNGYRVVCDAFSGACSPAAIKALLDRNAQVRNVSRLHAKLYRSAEMMVVGSANASNNGLNEDRHTMGLEAAMLVGDEQARAAALEWFDAVFASGAKIDEADLLKMRLLWKLRRRPLIRQSLADAILSNSEELADQPLRVHLYESSEPDDETKARYLASPYYDERTWDDESYPFYWGDFPGVQQGDELLSFEIDDEGVNPDGLWRILGAIGENGRELIWPALRLDHFQGRKLGKMSLVARKIARAIGAERLGPTPAPISLSELAMAISGL